MLFVIWSRFGVDPALNSTDILAQGFLLLRKQKFNDEIKTNHTWIMWMLIHKILSDISKTLMVPQVVLPEQPGAVADLWTIAANVG